MQINISDRQRAQVADLIAARFNYLRKAKMRKGERASTRAMELSDLHNLHRKFSVSESARERVCLACGDTYGLHLDGNCVCGCEQFVTMAVANG